MGERRGRGAGGGGKEKVMMDPYRAGVGRGQGSETVSIVFTVQLYIALLCCFLAVNTMSQHFQYSH